MSFFLTNIKPKTRTETFVAATRPGVSEKPPHEIVTLICGSCTTTARRCCLVLSESSLFKCFPPSCAFFPSLSLHIFIPLLDVDSILYPVSCTVRLFGPRLDDRDYRKFSVSGLAQTSVETCKQRRSSEGGKNKVAGPTHVLASDNQLSAPVALSLGMPVHLWAPSRAHCRCWCSRKSRRLRNRETSHPLHPYYVHNTKDPLVATETLVQSLNSTFVSPTFTQLSFNFPQPPTQLSSPA